MATTIVATRAQLRRISYHGGSITQTNLELRRLLGCRQPLRMKILSRTYHGNSATEINDSNQTSRASYLPLDTFARRHIGPSSEATEEMLKALDPPVSTLNEFIKQVLPADILSTNDLKLNTPSQKSKDSYSESEIIDLLKKIMDDNNSKSIRSYIGCGYVNALVPEVIKRNVLENPAWYTSYTPYQSEISQGRLESLLNFQTLVCDLTALPVANASLLDESTAAAEAMTLSFNALSASRQKSPNKTYFVSHLVHPQTKAVIQSRANGFGIKIEVGDVLLDGSKRIRELGSDLIGVLVQYPDTEGGVEDFKSLASIVHEQGATLSVGTDLLALTVLTPPGEFGADIAFGNSQRFGVPVGFGGPHAAFFAVNDKLKRKIPGRLIGVSKDRQGNKALRLTLQTREQHIRREKATSNVCTAQALLANMSAFYAIYHGPQGLKDISEKVIRGARILEEGLRSLGLETGSSGKGKDGRVLFDTVVVHVPGKARVVQDLALSTQNINLRLFDENRVGITVDETVTASDLKDLLSIFSLYQQKYGVLNLEVDQLLDKLQKAGADKIPKSYRRISKFLTHPVFNTNHSETEILRYIYHLQSKDLSLVHSMIPLGSCTMKLNSTTEMIPISWPQFSNVHPFVPENQTKGYTRIIKELEADLCTITGFDAVSLQPNSGAQGEYAGLKVIAKYQQQKPGTKRDICLIPVSAHGTNPASASMAGMRVVSVKCITKTGNLDMDDLKAKCEKYDQELAAIMVTYPSTFGVFEPEIKAICNIVHEHGGQVYMDGANVNAQIGLCSPAEIGADVCHLNLHKTFCIPHGGGGPGVGPIGVKAHLAPFLPGHPLIKTGGSSAIAPVSGAPFGSASILPISWAYIKMMGGRGLTHATKITLLNANYLMSRLRPHYPILYTNPNLRCAHEFILDIRGFKETAGIEAIDVAKRLQDYGFHAPTMSWPVANTLMVEPTESENKAELDRFIDALVSIRAEIKDIEEGKVSRDVNLLKFSPHNQSDLIVGDWDRPYTREEAAYPLPWLKEKKFWPSTTRVNDAYGDINLFCTCPPVEELE